MPIAGGVLATLSPQANVTPEECERGLRLLVLEAAFSGGATVLTTGVILTPFALHLGASNVMVGVLASAPFLSQLLQVPAILLVERLGARKRIAVIASLIGRAMLGVMAVTAFFAGSASLWVFLVAQFVLCGLGAVGGCAWNAWLRDLAPENRLGRLSTTNMLYPPPGSLNERLIIASAARKRPFRSPPKIRVSLCGKPSPGRFGWCRGDHQAANRVERVRLSSPSFA